MPAVKYVELSPAEERRLNELTSEFINHLPFVRGSLLEAGRIARELKPLKVKVGRNGGWRRFVEVECGLSVRTVDRWILDYERSVGLRPPAEKQVKVNVAKTARFNDDPDGYFADPTPEEQQFVESVSPEQIGEAAYDALLDADDSDTEDAIWQPRHSHWIRLVQKQELDYSPEPLVPIRDDAELKRLRGNDPKKGYNYLPQDRWKEYVRGEPIRRNTIRFSRYPDSVAGDRTEKIGLSFLLLKGVIPEDIQERARVALAELDWSPPSRAETKNAARFNRLVPKEQRKHNTPTAGELTFGYTARGGEGGGVVEFTRASRYQRVRYEAIYPLLQEMHNIFARVLPAYFRGAPGMEKQAGAHGANQRVSAAKRQAVTTPASTVTMLRSCPAALHTDPNGSRLGLACMTSVRGTEYTGGTFCLLQYGIQIPVQPGDLLIAATAREWHCNVTPVQGEKYSIVCYYRTGVDNPKMTPGKSVPI